MASPLWSTSGTVPAATTPSPSGAATDVQRAAQPLQVPAQLVEGGADRRVRLDQRALQLAGELVAVELLEQRVDLRGGAPRVQVDDVELLLHAEHGEVAHGADARARLLRLCSSSTGDSLPARRSGRSSAVAHDPIRPIAAPPRRGQGPPAPVTLCSHRPGGLVNVDSRPQDGANPLQPLLRDRHRLIKDDDDRRHAEPVHRPHARLDRFDAGHGQPAASGRGDRRRQGRQRGPRAARPRPGRRPCSATGRPRAATSSSGLLRAEGHRAVAGRRAAGSCARRSSWSRTAAAPPCSTSPARPSTPRTGTPCWTGWPSGWSATGRPLVIGSGSLPPGLPADTYAELCRTAREHGAQVIVDAARDALAAVTGGRARPGHAQPGRGRGPGHRRRRRVLRARRGPRRDPRAGASGRPGAARGRRPAGRGHRRARTAPPTPTTTGEQWFDAPAVAAVNPIGAGDAFVGGVAEHLAERGRLAGRGAPRGAGGQRRRRAPARRPGRPGPGRPALAETARLGREHVA